MSTADTALPRLDDLAVPHVGHGFRLQWEAAQNCHVLLYPEGMVKLNRSAGEILIRCDGVRTVAQLVQDLEAAFNTSALRGDVEAFLRMAGEQRWVTLSAAGSASTVAAAR